MKTEVEPIDQHTVKLRVVLEPSEFQPEVDRAARELASRVKLKGFRKGKIPRPVLEAHLGRGAIVEAAVESSLDRLLLKAVDAEDLYVVGAPQVDSVDVSTGGLSFEATLRVMPKIEVPRWQGLEIEISSLDVTDDEVDAEIDAFRERVAPLEPVGRPAREGDFVLIDLKGQIHKETLPGLSLTDFSYRVGSRAVVPKLDEELIGKRPGDILKFNDKVVVSGAEAKQKGPRDEGESALEEREATFTVIVKEVRERRPEPLTDAWVEDNTEFDSVEELKADVRKKLEFAKRMRARSEARHKAVEKLAEAVEVDLPEEVVEAEIREIADDFLAGLQRSRVTLEEYLESVGKSRAELEYEWRKQAITNMKGHLCLRAIAQEEGIEVSREELERRASALASSVGEDAERVKEGLLKGRSAASFAAGIIRAKTLDRVLERARISQEGGAEIRWEDLDVETTPEAESAEAGLGAGDVEEPAGQAAGS